MADSNIRLLIEMSGFQLHEKVAGDILTACSHNVEVALNEYFNNSSHYLKLSEKAAGVGAKKSSPSKSLAKDKSKASSLFKKYRSWGLRTKFVTFACLLAVLYLDESVGQPLLSITNSTPSSRRP